MVVFGWLLIIVGMFFVVSGMLALVRFRGFYNKVHGAGVIDCCGIPLSLLGLAMIQTSFVFAFKLFVIASLIFILAPVSSFALANAAMKDKIDQQGRLK